MRRGMNPIQYCLLDRQKLDAMYINNKMKLSLMRHQLCQVRNEVENIGSSDNNGFNLIAEKIDLGT